MLKRLLALQHTQWIYFRKVWTPAVCPPDTHWSKWCNHVASLGEPVPQLAAASQSRVLTSFFFFFKSSFIQSLGEEKKFWWYRWTPPRCPGSGIVSPVGPVSTVWSGKELLFCLYRSAVISSTFFLIYRVVLNRPLRIIKQIFIGTTTTLSLLRKKVSTLQNHKT